MASKTSREERRAERDARLKEEIERRAERRRNSARDENRSIWFSLGLFGLVGWSIAVPTVLGIALGAWMDGRFPGRVSWTLTFMILGVIIGSINAWRWVKQESRDD